MRKLSKKSLCLAAAALTLTAGISAGTAMAYFTTYAEASGNVTLNMGFTETTPTEEFSNWTKHVTVKNTGDAAGCEVVQLYIRDDYSDVVRPVKELKGFQKIFLEPGEMKIVRFKIAPEMLRYYNYDLQLVAEPGDFEVMIGTNSRDVKTARFTLN